MNTFVNEKRDQIAELCQKYRVRKLALFGSALGSDFDHQRSDVDFTVEFLPMPASERVRAYFGLTTELEALFARAVDLVELAAIENPYLKRNIEATREIVYAT